MPRWRDLGMQRGLEEAEGTLRNKKTEKRKGKGVARTGKDAGREKGKRKRTRGQIRPQR